MYDFSVVFRSLLLTLLGSSGTLIGALLVVLPSRPDERTLGTLQGVSAGLMLAISFLDLMPAAIEALGFKLACASFFAGVSFFAMVSALFQESDDGGSTDSPQGFLGGYLDKCIDGDTSAPGASSKVDEKSVKSESTMKEGENDKRRRAQAMMSGLLTALGIALHNFPEGIAVYLASLKEVKLGVTVGVAIALHNIPEGLCIALPVYFATGSKWEGLKLATLSGIAEPLGAMIVGLLMPSLLSESMVESMLAGVAGIMTFLSFHELLPLSYASTGKSHVNAALFIGMALMAFSLEIMHATGAE